METQQLRYVVAVARTGNFSCAAKQCHVLQPSLSQQIQPGNRCGERPSPPRRPQGAIPKAEVVPDTESNMLPLGKGVILDPFLGAGSTVAAADAVGYDAIGVELDSQYFAAAQKAIPRLAALYPGFHGQEIEVELNGRVEHFEADAQLGLALAAATWKPAR